MTSHAYQEAVKHFLTMRLSRGSRASLHSWSRNYWREKEKETGLGCLLCFVEVELGWWFPYKGRRWSSFELWTAVKRNAQALIHLTRCGVETGGVRLKICGQANIDEWSQTPHYRSELLGEMVIPCLAFWGNVKFFSTMAATFYITSSSVRKLKCLLLPSTVLIVCCFSSSSVIIIFSSSSLS